jgi:hypothetical protein
MRKKRRRRGGVPTSNRDPVSDGALRTYLKAVESAAIGLSDPEFGSGIHEHEAAEQASLLAAMRVARVYAVNPATYGIIRDEVYTRVQKTFYSDDLFEELSGDARSSVEDYYNHHKLRVPHTGLSAEAAVANEEAMAAIARHTQLIELPPVNRWPFRTMWVGLGGGVPLSPGQTIARYQWANLANMPRYIGGHVAWLAGWFVCMLWEVHVVVVEAILIPHTEEEVATCKHGKLAPPNAHLIIVRFGDRWVRGGDLVPWELRALMDLLIECKSSMITIEPGLRAGRIYQRAASHEGVSMPVPRPYYVLNVKQSIVKVRAEKTLKRRVPGKTWRLRHRVDVAGHERCRVKRGPMPIDPKVRASLLRRHYRLYTLEHPSPEDAERLRERGVSPKRHGEWLAILVTQVGAFKRGPDDAPYVPAIRKVL